MIDIAPSQPARNATVRTAAVIVAVLALSAGLLRILEPGRIAWIQAFLIVFGSLVVQAMPFVLLGALASAAIEVFVPVNALERVAGLPRPLQLPAAALAGVAFPICECGSVPVARRLAVRGLTPSAAVTFMLAAPVLNPVVIASTFVAYRARSSLWTMVIGRFALGMIVAIVVGWVLGSRSKDEVLRPRPEEAHAVLVEPGPPEARWRRFFLHTGNDFLFMGRYLLAGAAAAAMVQTFLPASFVSKVAGTPVLDIAVMMGLATVLSLCSESDAFVAASFVQFGPAAQLAFLVSGPMIDLKLGALYAGTFRRGFLPMLVVTVFATTLVGAMWVMVVAG
jgi:uncharacterized membrane protein YraQ (UPF0718 family)